MPDKITPSFNKDDVEIVQKDAAYQGYFRIDHYTVKHRLFAGGWSKPLSREVFERGHAAAALLFDPQLNKVVLIEQFRSGLLSSTQSPWLTELVAGIIETGETAEQVVLRETDEEADLIVQELIPIYEYWVSPGGSSERVALFCARVDASKAGGVHGLTEEGEDIRVCVIDSQDVPLLLANKQINNAMTIIALQWFVINEAHVRAKWV